MAEVNESENSKVNPFSFSNFVLKNDEPPKNLPLSKEEENPFSYETFSTRTSTTQNTQKQTKKKTTKARKLQIVEDVDSLTDIFADIPAQPIVQRKKDVEDVDAASNNSSDELSISPQSDTYILEKPVENSQDELIDQLQQLKLQNAELQREIEVIRNEYKEYKEISNKKITSLQKELEKTRRKEAEDTKALEDVVKMVEENLHTTTARAVKAETDVTKLKDELRCLKESHVSKSEYQALQTQHFYQLNTIKEKSLNASRLMRTAADKTEPHLRELQNGVASLRFLADTFDDIGMVSEIPNMKNQNVEDESSR